MRKTFDKSCLDGTRHPVHRTREEPVSRVGFRGRRQRAKLRARTHLDITLRTCLQEGERLLEPPRLKGSEPKLGIPFLMQHV